MGSVVSVSPFRCRMWALHDRLEAAVDEHTCKAEIGSFLRYGQLVPALGRPLQGDPNHDVELIYGARRLFVAQHVNKPLAIELRQLTDMEAIIAMDIENRQRRDISPYEQGLCYARWLRGKHFNSQEEIAQALKISASQVSRLLRLARLPAVVIGAFETPLDICETWGLDLADAWDDPERRASLAEKARSIPKSESRASPKEIFSQLIANTAKGRPVKVTSRDEVVTDDRGRSLFRIRSRGKWVALLLPLNDVSSAVLQEIRENVTGVLQRARLQVADCDRRSKRGHKSERVGESSSPL